jgi:hypothetical protein
MKPQQIAQLQELAGCWMPKRFFSDMLWVRRMLETNPKADKHKKEFLRYLWHQYRHQIAAMRKNRGKA